MEDNINNNNNLTNNNELNTNQNHYNNLEIEKNSFNFNNKSNESPNYYEKALSSESEAIKALIKLDMVHATNNYYNNIVEPKNAYKVFIRPDGKPDFGNYSHFNNYVKFDPKKYQRPEIFYGFVHDQYLVPQILNGKVNNEKKKENEKNANKEEDLKNNSKNNNKTIKVKNNSQKSTANTVKSLDDIMNKFNLKYIEPPPKEKKVTPPPEEIPPEEEEDNKDKNKGKKESAKSKTNIKDDKNKNTKPIKK